MKILKRYAACLILVLINILWVVVNPKVGWQSVSVSFDNLREILTVIPPIFILLGLLDVWVSKETMIKLMGEGSGLLGIAIAFLLGSVAAGPLYAAFPIAGVLLMKRSKFSNILVFIGAWSTTKIPLLLFEASSMGWKFMLARFCIDIPGIILIAYITAKLLSPQEKDRIYANAEKIE